MSTRSYIGNYRGYIYCHWDGYPEHNGEILKKYYKDPKKVDELISLGDISVLSENVNPDPSKPHNFDNKQENVVVAYHRDRGEPWEDVKPMVMSKDFEAKDTSIEYIYYFDENRKLWKYKELYADNPKWIWLKDEEDINLDEKIDDTLRSLAKEFIHNLIGNNLGVEIDTELDEMIDKISDKEIKKELNKMYDTYKYPKSSDYFKFQSYVMEELSFYIKNEKIKEYVKEDDINFYEYDNNLIKLSEYLNFFFKLDQAYICIDQKGLFNEVIDDVLDYLPKIEYVKNRLKEPYCDRGGISKLTFYSDTIPFYKKYQEEINELIADAFFNLETRDMVQLFGDKWDKDDPLALEDKNQNLLAWFGYEETARRVYTYLFEEEEN